MTPPPRAQITGLVLAGGRGSRMGGLDKGLQRHAGQPLALNALRRLAPQVGPLMINANRNLEVYAAMGVPVHADVLPDFAGPLAGLLTGLMHCQTPWLVTVPCDSPQFPTDLVARLAAAAAAAEADIAMATTWEDGELRHQPVFSLLRRELLPSLQAYLDAGQRKIDRWTGSQRCTLLRFDEVEAFANANTPEELQALQPGRQP
ncbi:MAG: molybdenum cofactor guanylyltransferase MobA [Burkholderiales bacterium]|nr:molybdenum cofactor guanylyltransferase MobA [Burkholderiales bacterium]